MFINNAMKQKLFFISIFIILISCKNEFDNFDCEDILEKKIVTKSLSPDRLIITKIQSNGIKNRSDLNFENITQISDLTVIKEFNALRIKNLKKDYFNRIPDFKISLLNKNQFHGSLLIAISKEKDSVFISDESYQSFSKIKFSDWNNLMVKGKNISYKNIKLFNLKTARNIYNYCNKNNLPVVLKNDYQEIWPKYDGQFKFVISRVENDLKEKEIICGLKTKYKNDNFKILTSGWNYTCSCSDCNDCLTEITFTIYCNKDFYDKFDVVKPKSWFDEFYADFEVIGNKIELEKLEKYLIQISDEY